MISTAWKCLLLWQVSILGGAFEEEGAGEKERGGGNELELRHGWLERYEVISVAGSVYYSGIIF